MKMLPQCRDILPVIQIPCIITFLPLFTLLLFFRNFLFQVYRIFTIQFYSQLTPFKKGLFIHAV
jgi:hypothetical protein